MEKTDARQNRIRKILYATIILAAVAFTFYLISRENLSQMVQTLGSADYRIFLAAVGVYFFGLTLWALRFKMGLLACGQNVPIKSSYLIVLASVFINNITPFTYSGGDPFARSFLLKKVCNTPYLCSFATLLCEFLIDLPIFLGLVAWGLFMRDAQIIGVILVLIWVVGVTIFILVAHKMFHAHKAPRRLTHFMWRIARILRRPVTKTQVGGYLKTFIRLVGGVLEHRRYFVTMILIGISFWILVISRFLLIFMAFGYSPQIPMLMLTLTLSSVVGLIPILPAGLGTVDFTYVSIFTVFGVPLPIALSVVLIERLISFVLGTLVGGVVASYLGVKSLNRLNSS